MMNTPERAFYSILRILIIPNFSMDYNENKVKFCVFRAKKGFSFLIGRFQGIAPVRTDGEYCVSVPLSLYPFCAEIF